MVTNEHFKKPEETAPLQELKSLVNQVSQCSEKNEVEEVQEGEITKEGTGDYPYASLDELLFNVEVSYPFPIHHTQMEELKSKKEDCHNMFLRCREKSCPTFCDLKDYDYYYYGCRQQGHPWFTLDTISRMVCLSQTGIIKRCI